MNIQKWIKTVVKGIEWRSCTFPTLTKVWELLANATLNSIKGETKVENMVWLLDV